MKIVFRLFAFLVILCALAGTGWGGYWLYRRYAPPGGSGRNMEVRLLARVGPAAPTGTSSGVDGDQGSGAASPAGTSSAPGVTQDNSAATPAATGPDNGSAFTTELASVINIMPWIWLGARRLPNCAPGRPWPGPRLPPPRANPPPPRPPKPPPANPPAGPPGPPPGGPPPKSPPGGDDRAAKLARTTHHEEIGSRVLRQSWLKLPET